MVISKTTAEKPIAIRFTAFPYDAVTAPGVSADVKVIGGVFGVHVLHLPPPPTKVVVENKGTLVMRPTIIEEGVSEAGLRHSSYPYGSDLVSGVVDPRSAALTPSYRTRLSSRPPRPSSSP